MLAHWIHTIFWRSKCDQPPFFESSAIAAAFLFGRSTSLYAHARRPSSYAVLPSSLLCLFGECCRPRPLHTVLPGWTFFTYCGSFRGGSIPSSEKQYGHDQFSRRCLYPADWYRQERPVHWVLSLPPLGPRVAGGRSIQF